MVTIFCLQWMNFLCRFKNSGCSIITSSALSVTSKSVEFVRKRLETGDNYSAAVDLIKLICMWLHLIVDGCRCIMIINDLWSYAFIIVTKSQHLLRTLWLLTVPCSFFYLNVALVSALNNNNNSSSNNCAMIHWLQYFSFFMIKSCFYDVHKDSDLVTNFPDDWLIVERNCSKCQLLNCHGKIAQLEAFGVCGCASFATF